MINVANAIPADAVRLTALIQSLRLGIIVQGPHAEIRMSNGAAHALLGLTEDQLTGKAKFDPAWNAIREDGSPVPGPTYAGSQAIATKQPVRGMVMGVSRPGNRDRVWLMVDADAEFDATGNVTQVICTFSDLTAQRRNEAALQEAAQSQTAILNALPVHIALLDPEGTIINVNESWRRFASANALPSKEFSIGENYIRACEKASGACSEEALQVANGLREVLNGMRPSFTLEYPCHSPEEKRWFRLMACPLREDRAVGAVVMHVNVTERRLDHEVLQSSLKELADVKHAIDAHAIIAVTDPHGVITLVNDKFCAISGYAREELVGQNHRLISSGFHPKEFFRHLWSTIGSGRIWKGEVCNRAKDGSLYWVDTTIVPFLGLEGKPVQYVAIRTDITERKRAELALRKSERQLTDLMGSVDGIVWEADATTFQFTFVSARAERLLGYPVAEWIETPTFWADHIHPEDRETAVRYCASCTQANRNHEFEYRMMAADGRTVWLRDIVTVEVEANRAVKLQGLMVDITERKAAEIKLRESEERLHAYINQATDALFVHDLSGRLVDVNSQACRSLGYTREELLGMNVIDVNPNFDLASAQARWKKTLPGEAHTLVTTHRRKDGSILPVEIHLGSFDLQGKRHYMGLVRDITERIAAEAALNERERLLSDSQRIAHVGSWSLNIGSEVLQWTDETYRIHGVSRDTFVPSVDNLVRLFHPDDRKIMQEWIRACLAGEHPPALEFRVIRPDGDVRILFGNGDLQCAADQTPNRIIGTVQDITERKSAEAKVRETEERYRTLAQNLPNGAVVMFDRNLRYLLADGTGLAEAGLNKERVEGKTLHEVFPPETCRLVEPDYRAALAGETSLREVPFAGRIYETRTLPLRDAEGNIVGGMAMSQNITARKAAEAALSKSEASLAAAQARARVGSWELSLAEKTGVWSAEMFRLFGRDPALGAPPFGEYLDSIHPDDREKFHREFNEAMAQRNEFTQEFRIVRPDNSILWIEGRGTLIRDAAGLPVRLVGTSQDITERKNAEAALRESEERFRQLTENIGEVFWITDAATSRTLYVSPAYETIWGRSCRSLYDSPSTWHEAIHPEDRERIRAATAKMALGTYDEEYRITRPGGTLRWIHDKAFTLKNENGTVTRIVGVAEDVTEHRHLEAQFRQAQKMEAIGTLAGGIAHDFNNILGAVKGYAQLAQDAAPDRPDLQEHLDAVLQGTHRAADLVKQIITFSRQHETQHSPVLLQTIVTEALTLLRATIPTTVEIKTVVEHHAPPVMADATQIHQVVMNLCTNAWHAMKSRAGRLEVRVEAVVLDAAFAQAHSELKPGPHLRLTVSDTGCGMDQATLSRIFEPFFTTKGPGEGSGLGLAVVHGIVSNHHGAIIVHSEPDVGTTFHLYFPESAGPAAALAPSSPSRSPLGHNERILLVDDEQPLVRLGTIILQRSGYVVVAFASSKQALAAFKAQPHDFDLVVSDLAMPEMSGLDLAGEIRRVRPDLPVILTSGYIDQTTKELVRTSNLQQVLLKPFTVESLSQAVHQVLAARQKA